MMEAKDRCGSENWGVGQMLLLRIDTVDARGRRGGNDISWRQEVKMLARSQGEDCSLK